MTFSNLRRTAGGLLLAAAAAFPTAIAAQGSTTRPPTMQELARLSPSGSYLAARHAGQQRDSAAASIYYRAALRADPRNNELLSQAFLSSLIDGDVEEAVRLAERVVQVNRNHRIARLALAARAIKQKQYSAARQQLAQAARDPITELTATLLTSWTQVASNEVRAAVEGIDKLSGPEWYAIFRDLHAGMILDLAGRTKDAGKRLERAHQLDPNALRAVDAFGRWTSRNGTKADALKIYEAFDKVLPRHPLILEAIAEVKDDEKLGPLVESAQAGAAEALYGLGGSLGRQGGGEDLGLVYLQLAIYLQPKHALALLSLADLYENLKKPELAIRTYGRVPEDSPLRRNAEIQLGVNLDSVERTDEAKKHLDKLIVARPGDLDAVLALGNILRGRKQFSECAQVYSQGINALTSVEKPQWVIFYFRGICNERAKKWEQAETDLKKALELNPDQPDVLNYLGYSWIDQGRNLEDGMRMIRQAVDQRPNNGYIVDSLGWAHYRIGEFDEAVKQLERAIELKPEDATINDHLGDAYWKVGRTLEARFQWAHARDLKPEPDDLKRIEEKLASGIPDEPSSSAADVQQPRKPGQGG